MATGSRLLLSFFLSSALLSSGIGVIGGSDPTKSIIYHGTIAENAKQGDEVHLNAPLSSGYHDNLVGGEVCGYTIYKWHSEQPFKVKMEDRKTGAARIVLDDGFKLDHEKKHRYNFEIAPYDCVTGSHGNRHKLHVKVLDVNEFAPVWKEQSYAGSIEEGKMEEEILQVTALDADGTKPYSKICQYHLLTEDAPFVISESGYLRNTRPLKYEDQSYFQLEVKAEDCGGLISDPTIIEIDVKPVCIPRWTDVDGELDVSGPMRRAIMAAGALDLCGAQCDVTQVSVSMEMETSHIGKGCDRETFSLQANRKICGASNRNIDLLPGPGKQGSWTRTLPTDGGLDSNPVFVFDGKTTAVEYPGGSGWKTLGSSFTISTWMKHSRNLDDTNPRGSKEQILCHSDGEGLNRHHASLFIHNCRLILLLRQEPSDEDPEVLKPAEWRWILPETCDGKWHQFTINVNFPQVVLYLDGKLVLENTNNSETLEDWPLHVSTEVHSSKVVVGACWQGAKRRYGQFFAGHLSALTILLNDTDGDDVIQCLNSCKEKLDVIGMDEMTTGMSVSMNSEMSRLTVNGRTVESVEKIVRNVGYVNSRNAPTPGNRPVTVETVVKCSDGNSVPVETVNLTIAVQETQTVTLLLNATNVITRDERHVTAGQALFANLAISAHQQQQQQYGENDKQDSSAESRDRYLLDSCVVQVDPKLNTEAEYLSFPQNLTDRLGLEVDSTEDGLVIAGADRLSNYERFLRLVQYMNRRPQDINSRTFVLSCTELTGHFISNQLRITLEVIHVVHERAPVAHALMANRASVPHASHQIASDNMRLIAKSFPTNLKYDSQETGVGVAVVMVVCVGFVIMLIVLGVMRVRSAQRYKGKDQGERNGNWDNSSLTITVNPMDPDNMYEEEIDNTGCHDDDTESEDEDGIYSRADLDMKKAGKYVGGGGGGGGAGGGCVGGPIGSKSTLVL